MTDKEIYWVNLTIFIPVLALVLSYLSFYPFMIHFVEAGRKVLSIWMYSAISHLLKNHTVLNDINEKCSVSYCFQGHNFHPQVTFLCILLVSCFPSEQFSIF